jgi:hypothetical protein
MVECQLPKCARRSRQLRCRARFRHSFAFSSHPAQRLVVQAVSIQPELLGCQRRPKVRIMFLETRKTACRNSLAYLRFEGRPRPRCTRRRSPQSLDSADTPVASANKSAHDLRCLQLLQLPSLHSFKDLKRFSLLLTHQQRSFHLPTLRVIHPSGHFYLV